MATASYISEDVEPKPMKFEDHAQKMEELKQKAFISPILPEDFLRVLLDPRQIAESKDSQLARQLQFGVGGGGVGVGSSPQYGMYREHVIDYGRGRLQIDVVEAKLNKNYGWITRMDPYVRLKVGPRRFETPTAYNGNKNPVWRKSILCYLPRNVDSLVIEIYDEKSFSDDEIIAFVKFPLPKSLFDGIFLDEWIPLSGKLGENKEGYINIQMLFTPIENLQNETQNRNHRHLTPPVAARSTANTSPSTGDPIVQPSEVQLPQDLSSASAENSSSSSSAAAVASATAVLHSSHSQRQEAAAAAAAESYSEEDLKSIKELFPTFDEDVIKSILELNSGNKEAAIEALLQMN